MQKDFNLQAEPISSQASSPERAKSANVGRSPTLLSEAASESGALIRRPANAKDGSRDAFLSSSPISSSFLSLVIQS